MVAFPTWPDSCERHHTYSTQWHIVGAQSVLVPLLSPSSLRGIPSVMVTGGSGMQRPLPGQDKGKVRCPWGLQSVRQVGH